MTNDGIKEKKLPCCCISHEFYKVASNNPNKIAVIHSRGGGGAKLAREFREFYENNGNNQTAISDTNNKEELFGKFIQTKSLSSNPPVYEGDVVFTFSEILTAVGSLSRRLRLILDGGDDPSLIKLSLGSLPVEQPLNSQILKSSNHSNIGVEQSTMYSHMYTPRILGIYMVPSVEYIIAVLSVMRCGEAFMPVDPSWPKERVLSVISSSSADLIIGCSSSLDGSCCYQIDKSHWLVDSSSCPVLLFSMNGNAKTHIAFPRLLWPCESKRLRQFCYLMYTSGSTGKPKGVCGTESGLLNRFLWMQELYPLNGQEFMLFKTSISFIDHLQEILGALLTTCTMVVPPFDELKENLFCITDYLQAYSINRLVAVPSLMRAVLPTLRNSYITRIQRSLKLLILSGEILHLSLWDDLTKLFPKTDILNLYGSTEVSGDCTYFDCKRLPLILETEALSCVPIGIPIPNCDVVLVGEDAPNHGEIYVGGHCVATGYLNYSAIMPLDAVKLHPGSCFCCSIGEHGSLYYFKTGDFAKQLQGGDLVFLGRNDRTIKVNGQRIALEEIENTLREHQDVVDAAVVSCSGQGEVAVLEAYIVTNQGDDYVENLRSSFRGWLVEKLPLAMIPNCFFFTKSLPMSSAGKVDYSLLANSRCSMASVAHVCSEIEEVPDSDLLQTIKEAFSDALRVEKVSDNDDFFAIGGDSISAAHASHKLGLNMRLLYTFPSPLKLAMALLEQGLPVNHELRIGTQSGVDMKALEGNMSLLSNSKASNFTTNKPRGWSFSNLVDTGSEYYPNKFFKTDFNPNFDYVTTGDGFPWDSISKHIACSFSRSNRVRFEEGYELQRLFQATWSHGTLRDEKASMQELWKVHMESCVDASPLIIVRERDIFLYIGSHSRKFICINAKSGSVQWEVQLEGRVECSAAVLDDFSEVVVGCFQGNIYFLNSLNGSINWVFQTGGEVKCQPVIDKCRHLVWCGSYDHNLYALDYRSYCCIYKLPCGGSIYGSPAIDEVHERLYVASTNGRVTSLSLKALPFSVLWLQDLEAPIFGSLSMNHSNGNVICCLVNGHVVAMDASGSIIWKGITGGPIFAGPCIPHVLYPQVLVCSRDGSIYSFELENGSLLWKHDVGEPIISSAYVDENLQLKFDLSLSSDRLVCVCGSSGSISLLRINLESSGETDPPKKYMVQEFARLKLQGDIFSSPVMIGGRIFVGSRDDYVHCIGIEGQISVEP